jgi:hypothetical protein
MLVTGETAMPCVKDIAMWILKILNFSLIVVLIGCSINCSKFANLPNPSSRTMAPVFTKPLTGMSTRRFLGVKRGRRVRLTT